MHVFAPRAWPIAAALLSLAACGPDHTPAAFVSHAEANASTAALTKKVSEDKPYLIAPMDSVTNDQPGVCFDVRNGLQQNGAVIQLWDCAGSENQKFVRDGNNLRIYDDFCVAVAEGREVPGGGIQLEACDFDFMNQGWILDNDRMQLEGTELCLEVVNGLVTRGAGVQLAKCNQDAVGQRFGFSEADAVTGPGTANSRYRASAKDRDDGQDSKKKQSSQKKDSDEKKGFKTHRN